MNKGGNFSDCVIFSRMSKQFVCCNMCCKVRVAKFSEAAKDLERHTMSTGATPAADEVKNIVENAKEDIQELINGKYNQAIINPSKPVQSGRVTKKQPC